MRLSAFLLGIALAVMPPALVAQPGMRGMIGKRVVSVLEQPVGEVKDLVIDARSGRIRWVMVEHGGLLGIAEDEAAVPPGQLVVEDGRLRLRVAPPALERLPALDRLEWPAMRASELLDREVLDRRHRDSGEIVDLVVDLRGGRVEAAVIDLRDDWQSGERRVTVPFERFSLPRDLGRYAVLNVDREDLLRPPSPRSALPHGIVSLPARVGTLVGAELADFSGERRGRVAELVVDLANGRVVYAVLETPEKTLAFPFAALELSLDNRRLLIDEPPERLARAPALDDCAGLPYWSAYWQGRVPPRLARASELLGRRFDGGELADIVIDAHEGAVAFALIRLGTDALHPVPLGAFSLQGAKLAFDLPLERLDRRRDFPVGAIADPRSIEDSARYAARLR